MVEEIEGIVGSREPVAKPKNEETRLPTTDSRLILLYCWRGGMRSAGVAWLLDLYGFKVYTLVGGYKKYRNHVLDSFKLPFQFNILGGYTGSGKTNLLNTLKEKNQPVIDLEGIANHKGSAFGNIGLPAQPSQEMFENLLSNELTKIAKAPHSPLVTSPSPLTTHHSPIWLEDESQRIGLINIPADIWKQMRQSPVYFLDIPFEERLKQIVLDYGPLDQEQMILAIERISQKLGSLNAKNAILHLKEGKISESFEILLKYYDKFYFKGLHNREGLNTLLHTINCTTATSENANLLIHELHNQQQKV
jgi:tRNA 2-selenouridine synthase